MLVLLTALGAALLLVGCGAASPGGPVPGGPSTSPSPTSACPENPHAELPAGCAPYDPDAAMAQNDRYRERMELGDDARTQGEELAPRVRQTLTGLEPSTLTEESVAEALHDAGLDGIQVRADDGEIRYAVGGPKGGCVYGSLGPGGVSVDVGGYILDGGCLPAQ